MTLNTIQKQFPYVKQVVDADESIAISVEERDAKSGRKKDSNNCALAQACKRQHIADAAIIGISISYLIKGDTAVRYKTSQGIGREITSFDRHQDFAAGKDYVLSKIGRSIRIGTKHRGGKESGKLGKRKRIIHRTEFIRNKSTP